MVRSTVFIAALILLTPLAFGQRQPFGRDNGPSGKTQPEPPPPTPPVPGNGDRPDKPSTEPNDSHFDDKDPLHVAVGQVYIKFITAIEKGDVDAARKMCVENPADKGMLEALTAFESQLHTLNAVYTKAFQAMGNEDRFQGSHFDPNTSDYRHMRLLFTPDQQTVLVGFWSGKSDMMAMHKVKEEWKIDVAAWNTLNGLSEQVGLFNMRANTYHDMIAAIQNGKYKDPIQAWDAQRQNDRMFNGKFFRDLDALRDLRAKRLYLQAQGTWDVSILIPNKDPLKCKLKIVEDKLTIEGSPDFADTAIILECKIQPLQPGGSLTAYGQGGAAGLERRWDIFADRDTGMLMGWATATAQHNGAGKAVRFEGYLIPEAKKK